MMDKPEFRLAEPLPEVLEVGLGQYQLIRGQIDCGELTVVKVSLNQSEQRDCRLEWFPGRDQGRLELVVSVLWLPGDLGQRHTLELCIQTREKGRTTVSLGEVELIAAPSVELKPGSTIGDAPLVAICMAIYNPEVKRLARQVESILCQGYRNWMLILSDDHSDQANWPEIEALCNLDPRRIRLYRHDHNLGFYHNFERALAYVPGNAALVALADQDDEWYPEKLQSLVSSLDRDPGVMLTYSDMRIVSESGELLSDTYWRKRKNEYRDFSSLFVSNTVTGAASLFRRELLEVALPFPAPAGGAFHDHWIACVAMCRGKLAYVSDPLYDYIQYADSVIGHCDSDPGSTSSRIVKQFSAPDQGEGEASNKWLQVYFEDCLRLRLIADTLKQRLPDLAGNRTLNLMNGGYLSVLKLFSSYLKGSLSGRTTQAAELGLIRGWMAQIKLRRENQPGATLD